MPSFYTSGLSRQKVRDPKDKDFFPCCRDAAFFGFFDNFVRAMEDACLRADVKLDSNAEFVAVVQSNTPHQPGLMEALPEYRCSNASSSVQSSSISS